jgi:hypothetical protein
MFTAFTTAQLYEISIKRGIIAFALSLVFVAAAPRAFSQG